MLAPATEALPSNGYRLPAAELHDPHGRRLQYLRLSLTEACNMSCTYCLPDGFPEWLQHKAKLDLPAIETLLAGFRDLGFSKVRFTGGEPTVHPNCKAAVASARRLGFEHIALTTNGLLLRDLQSWIDAGLTQLNISLDSLRLETFAKITKSRGLRHVLNLIDAAIACELPLKLNTVLLRSVNGEEAAELIDWALQRPLTLRFIELMATGLNYDFARRERVLNHELLPLLRERGLQAAVTLRPEIAGPESVWRSEAHRGSIGFISPMSCNFCDRCNRLRVTAQGRLRLCLFGDHSHALDLSSPDRVAADVRRLIEAKQTRHGLDNGNFGDVQTFRVIGG